jgi:hypothetical protein
MITNIPEMLAASIISTMRLNTLLMEAASTSVMSVNFYQTTWHNNPEDSYLQLCLHFTHS